MSLWNLHTCLRVFEIWLCTLDLLIFSTSLPLISLFFLSFVSNLLFCFLCISFWHLFSFLPWFFLALLFHHTPLLTYFFLSRPSPATLRSFIFLCFFAVVRPPFGRHPPMMFGYHMAATQSLFGQLPLFGCHFSRCLASIRRSSATTTSLSGCRALTMGP